MENLRSKTLRNRNTTNVWTVQSTHHSTAYNINQRIRHRTPFHGLSYSVTHTKVQVTDKPQETMHITWTRPRNRQQINAVDNWKKTTKDDATVPQEYEISRKMRLIDTAQGKWYVVRWGGYGPWHDKLEQGYHITTHFVTQYWNHLTSKRQLERCK